MADEQQPAADGVRVAPTDEVGEVLDFLRRYGRPLLVGAAAAVLIFGVTNWRRAQRATRAAEASRLWLGAQSPEQLQLVRQQYPGTPAAAIALLSEAAALFHAGRYDEAAARHEEFQTRFAKHPMAPAAALNRITCLEAQGRLDEALAQYESFTGTPTNAFTPLARFGAGRCLEALGRKDEARAVYEEFIVAHPDSPWTAQAEAALLYLGGHAAAVAPGT